MKKLQLPYGVQDYLPKECYNKDLTEKRIASVFYSNGYEKVETGTLEYVDMFDGVVPKSAINKMFKMTDNDGSLIVLRPDTTLQICRMAVSKLDTSVVNKLYYIENCYEYFQSDNKSSRTREFSQIGLELLGKSDAEGDIEVISLAIEALLSAGLTDFLIDIGHIGFFNGLMEEYGICRDDSSALRSLINNKDVLGVELFLREKAVSEEAKTKFMSLSTLFGGVAVLDKAQKLVNNKISLAAVENLRTVYSTLKAYGYEKYISLDLGMLQGDYYSGIVFRGLVQNLGVCVLDGGRYDNLCGKFASNIQAVGFAIGVKRLLVALDNQKLLSEPAPCDIAYINIDGAANIEFTEVKKLKESKKRVIKLFDKCEEALTNYCKANNIKTAYIFRKSGTKIINL